MSNDWSTSRPSPRFRPGIVNSQAQNLKNSICFEIKDRNVLWRLAERFKETEPFAPRFELGPSEFNVQQNDPQRSKPSAHYFDLEQA